MRIVEQPKALRHFTVKMAPAHEDLAAATA
jgi:hypothetical protein